MRIELQPGDELAIDASLLDNPSETIIGSRIFTIDDGNASTNLDVEIRGLDFQNAFAPEAGGVIWSRENLTLVDTVFINNGTVDPDETEFDFPAVDQTGLHGGAVYLEGTGLATKPTLTIRTSLFTGNSTSDSNADGGAIYVLDANLDIDDTTITGNSTTMGNSDGAGVALKNSNFTSLLSTITGNLAAGGASDGGGLFVDFSGAAPNSVTMTDSVVSGNGTSGSNSEGGGVYVLGGITDTVTLNNSVVGENTTDGNQSHGGGIFASGVTLALNRTMVQVNSAAGAAANGGGIALMGGAAVIDATMVHQNQVTGSGGQGAGIWNNGGVLTVRGSTISENQATHAQGLGGGVYSDTNLSSQSTLILNSTISGNSAGLRGGGVYNGDGRTDIKHSTITNNSTSAINTGSGVASVGNAATTLTTVQSSIIAGNVGVAGGTRTDVDHVVGAFNNTFQSLGYNVIGTGNALGAFDVPGTPDKENILNPGLAPLGDNGSPPGSSFSLLTHFLLPGSAAINAGSPSFNPNVFSPPLNADQRGAARVQLGQIDAGSFELGLAPALPANFDNDNDVDGNDFLIWQRNLGRTSASQAQGDANNDQVVNGADLAVWKGSFGSLSGVPGASSAFSSAALHAEEAEPSAPPDAYDLSSLASLGVPGASIPAAEDDDALYSENMSGLTAVETRSTSASAWQAIPGGSWLTDDGMSDSELLLAGDVGDAAAEDAVFAAWGEKLL
jgi:hypothetical protein